MNDDQLKAICGIVGVDRDCILFKKTTPKKSKRERAWLMAQVLAQFFKLARSGKNPNATKLWLKTFGHKM